MESDIRLVRDVVATILMSLAIPGMLASLFLMFLIYRKVARTLASVHRVTEKIETATTMVTEQIIEPVARGVQDFSDSVRDMSVKAMVSKAFEQIKRVFRKKEIFNEE